jgi:two-component system, chemotaxis family, sensor kinase CheA
MDPLAELRDIYFQECDELILSLEACLDAMEQGEDGPEQINAAFRAIHSIKGGAGAFGYKDLVAFAHVFEAALDRLRNGSLRVADAPIRLFMRCSDVLADIVAAARSDTDAPNHADLIEELRIVASGSADQSSGKASMPEKPQAIAQSAGAQGAAPTNASAPSNWTIKLTPGSDLFRRAVEPLRLILAIEELGFALIMGELGEAPELQDFPVNACFLTFDIRLEAAIGRDQITAVLDLWLGPDEYALIEERDESAETTQPSATAPLLSRNADTGSEIKNAPQPGKPSAAASGQAQAASKPAGSLRVDLDRIDRMMNLVGEIVITQSMLISRAEALSPESGAGLHEGLQTLLRQTRALQDSMMAVRAQPVRAVFQRMPRLARELAASLGKEVRLTLFGEATEVDKTIIEELADPLTHMLRNAMDHGLENPEERDAAGKPREGAILLSADQRGGRIVITLKDDGRGINRKRVLQKAIDAGILLPDATPAPEDIDALIFHPGLSTAEKVTDVSGRGVGMDVVKRNVEHLGGRITVSSDPGRGCIFTLSLPLTLAVLDGMVVRTGRERFVIPTASVIETLKFDSRDVETLPGGLTIMRRREQVAPLMGLGRLLGVRDEPSEEIIVLAETDLGRQIGLQVDEIIGQQQVVVKSLETSFGRVPGASAATILGDGRVALIVDVDGLPHLAGRAVTSPSLQQWSQP